MKLFERIGADMKKVLYFICVALIAPLAGSCSSDAKKATTESIKPRTTYTTDWESLKKRNPAPDWFRDAKFGIYFHWGVYTVPAFSNYKEQNAKIM
jgi:alpha-L-fucosidase